MATVAITSLAHAVAGGTQRLWRVLRQLLGYITAPVPPVQARSTDHDPGMAVVARFLLEGMRRNLRHLDIHRRANTAAFVRSGGMLRADGTIPPDAPHANEWQVDMPRRLLALSNMGVFRFRLLATVSENDVAFFDSRHPMVLHGQMPLPPADPRTGQPTAAVLQLREMHPELVAIREGVRLSTARAIAHVVCSYASAALGALFYYCTRAPHGMWLIVDHALTAADVARELPLPPHIAAVAPAVLRPYAEEVEAEDALSAPAAPAGGGLRVLGDMALMIHDDDSPAKLVVNYAVPNRSTRDVCIGFVQLHPGLRMRVRSVSPAEAGAMRREFRREQRERQEERRVRRRRQHHARRVERARSRARRQRRRRDEAAAAGEDVGDDDDDDDAVDALFDDEDDRRAEEKERAAAAAEEEEAAAAAAAAAAEEEEEAEEGNEDNNPHLQGWVVHVVTVAAAEPPPGLRLRWVFDGAGRLLQQSIGNDVPREEGDAAGGPDSDSRFEDYTAPATRDGGGGGDGGGSGGGDSGDSGGGEASAGEGEASAGDGEAGEGEPSAGEGEASAGDGDGNGGAGGGDGSGGEGEGAGGAAPAGAVSVGGIAEAAMDDGNGAADHSEASSSGVAAGQAVAS